MLEKTVEKYLNKKVKEAGGLSFKWSSPSHRGVPDRIVFINSSVWFIELKRPGGKTTKLQDHIGEQIKQYTSNYCVISSKDEIDQFVSSIFK